MDDRVSGVSPTYLGNKDSAYAIGREFSVILPAKKFIFLVRGQQQ